MGTPKYRPNLSLDHFIIEIHGDLGIPMSENLHGHVWRNPHFRGDVLGICASKPMKPI
jgi:hypothetical protein